MLMSKKGKKIVNDLQGFLDTIETSPIVILQCDSTYFPADKVEFLDIHEDISGRDVMTFECPTCGEQHQSLILG
jgi:hypothetical protein